jgi:hypothetical protein
MLQNRIYRGEIVHKDQSYPAEHEAILEKALWDSVQVKLAANAIERGSGQRARSPSLLAGLLFDAEGHPMTPSHAVKQGRRYRYYISRPLVTGTRSEFVGGLRIPAAEIEPPVTGATQQLLCNAARLSATLSPYVEGAVEQRRALRTAADLASLWPNLSAAQSRRMLVQILRRIDVLHDRIELRVSPCGLIALLCAAGQQAGNKTPVGDEEAIVLSVPAQLQRAGQGMALVINESSYDGRAAEPDHKLVKLVARAHLLRDKLLTGGIRLSHIARRQQLNRSYCARIVQLSYLAPDITKAILDGCQPRNLTVRKLVARNLPLAWAEQRTVLGFTQSEPRPSDVRPFDRALHRTSRDDLGGTT